MNDIQTIQNKISDTSGEIVMYQPDETIRLEVRLGEDTVWLSQQQMAELFMSSRTNIVEHIQHIYSEKELEEISTCRNFRQVRQEGKRMVTRDIPMYNLDMIISVGYRINSKRGTHVTRDCPLLHFVSCYTAEIEARRKQYEYYREKILTFKRKSA